MSESSTEGNNESEGVETKRHFMRVALPGVFEGMIGEVRNETFIDGYGWVMSLTFNQPVLYLEGDEDKSYGFGVHELEPVFITPEEYDALASTREEGNEGDAGKG